MVRCEAFYEKAEEMRNLGPEEFIAFCMKDPETAKKIMYYLDKVRPLVQKLITKSEILSEEKVPMGTIVSERASRMLVSEKDKNVAEMATEKIVKKAEQKVMEGSKPRVTEREVKKIIEETKEELKEKPECPTTKGRRRGGDIVISSEEDIPILIKGLEYVLTNLNNFPSPSDVAEAIGKDVRWFGARAHLPTKKSRKKKGQLYNANEEELRSKLDILRDQSKYDSIRRFSSNIERIRSRDVKDVENKQERLAEISRRHKATMDCLNTNLQLHHSVESYVKNGVLFCPVCGKGNGSELRWNCHREQTLMEIFDVIMSQREAAINEKAEMEANI